MVRFSQSFWDKDPNGTNGYEVVIKRLKDGKKLCDAFSEFLKQRAKAEDDYGKLLIRLAQQATGSEETGSLGDAWTTLRKETEIMGINHCDLGRKIDELDKKVKAFRDEQKNERTKLDDRMKKLQKEKRSAYDNVIKAKRQYDQRCKDLDNVTESHESYSTQKDEEKFRNRKARAKTAQENADRQYQSSVKSLEQAHEVWEQEMEVTCDRFQELEEQRIRFLRNEMWLYSNVTSQGSIDDDAICESIRLRLEKCDETKDITTFIHGKQTGSERPSPLKYENYYHPSGSNDNSMEMNMQSKVLSLGKNQPPKQLPVSKPVDEDPYATIESLEKPSQAPSVSVIASFDYSAQGEEELSLKKGDVIELITCENAEWGRGKLLRNGRTGAFPIAFVQKLS